MYADTAGLIEVRDWHAYQGTSVRAHDMRVIQCQCQCQYQYQCQSSIKLHHNSSVLVTRELSTLFHTQHTLLQRPSYPDIHHFREVEWSYCA